MNKVLIVLATLLGFITSSCGTLKAQTKSTQNTQMDVSRSIQIFRDVVTGTANLYVDTMNIEKITTQGINAMLSMLDPYTVYMPEVEKGDFDFMTTGEYAGIGAYIQQVDSTVYVQYPMPGSPAEKSGLKPGDAFIEIDGETMNPATASKVSSKLKGPVGTKVEVKVQHIGEETPRSFTLTRDNVSVDQVVYSGIMGDGIGFIRLSTFTDKSAENVRDAYLRLTNKAPLKGLILDLRSNGGGVLDDAIKILGMFLPKGTEVLTTKGKLPQTTQSYRTTQEPLAVDLPLAVLINGASASASEILSGTIQDLDRGVLVGSKSFGKGLVQTTRPVSYDGILKVTISRYYIPSGRSIQQLDYSHRNPDGSVAAVPDSLTKVFYTKNGRPVKDGGGIRPDVEVEDEILSAPVYTMLREGEIFMFARELASKRELPDELNEIVISDEDYEAFLSFLEERKFEYGKLSLQALERLEELAEFEGYKERSASAFEALKSTLTPNLRTDTAKEKNQIKSLLRAALAVYRFGTEGQFAVNLESDRSIDEAIRILSTPKEYQKLLAAPNNVAPNNE